MPSEGIVYRSGKKKLEKKTSKLSLADQIAQNRARGFSSTNYSARSGKSNKTGSDLESVDISHLTRLDESKRTPTPLPTVNPINTENREPERKPPNTNQNDQRNVGQEEPSTGINKQVMPYQSNYVKQVPPPVYQNGGHKSKQQQSRGVSLPPIQDNNKITGGNSGINDKYKEQSYSNQKPNHDYNNNIRNYADTQRKNDHREQRLPSISKEKDLHERPRTKSPKNKSKRDSDRKGSSHRHTNRSRSPDYATKRRSKSRDREARRQSRSRDRDSRKRSESPKKRRRSKSREKRRRSKSRESRHRKQSIDRESRRRSMSPDRKSRKRSSSTNHRDRRRSKSNSRERRRRSSWDFDERDRSRKSSRSKHRNRSKSRSEPHKIRHRSNSMQPKERRNGRSREETRHRQSFRDKERLSARSRTRHGYDTNRRKPTVDSNRKSKYYDKSSNSRSSSENSHYKYLSSRLDEYYSDDSVETEELMRDRRSRHREQDERLGRSERTGKVHKSKLRSKKPRIVLLDNDDENSSSSEDERHSTKTIYVRSKSQHTVRNRKLNRSKEYYSDVETGRPKHLRTRNVVYYDDEPEEIIVAPRNTLSVPRTVKQIQVGNNMNRNGEELFYLVPAANHVGSSQNQANIPLATTSGENVVRMAHPVPTTSNRQQVYYVNKSDAVYGQEPLYDEYRQPVQQKFYNQHTNHYRHQPTVPGAVNQRSEMYSENFVQHQTSTNINENLSTERSYIQEPMQSNKHTSFQNVHSDLNLQSPGRTPDGQSSSTGQSIVTVDDNESRMSSREDNRVSTAEKRRALKHLNELSNYNINVAMGKATLKSPPMTDETLIKKVFNDEFQSQMDEYLRS